MTFSPAGLPLRVVRIQPPFRSAQTTIGPSRQRGTIFLRPDRDESAVTTPVNVNKRSHSWEPWQRYGAICRRCEATFARVGYVAGRGFSAAKLDGPYQAWFFFEAPAVQGRSQQGFGAVSRDGSGPGRCTFAAPENPWHRIDTGALFFCSAPLCSERVYTGDRW